MLDQLTPTAATDLLRRHDIAPNRRLGQNFLIDPNTARRIVRLAGIESGDSVLEIGPGLGSLTVAMAAVGARIVAVEVDVRVADALAEVIDDAPDVQVVVADALEVDLEVLCPPQTKLVANLPYSVATPLLLRVLDEVSAVRSGLVMVQREVGERWAAKPGGREYSATTLHVDYLAEAEVVGEVPPTVFLPRPKVASVLVGFRRRDHPPVKVDDPADFMAFVKGAFGHRRKTLRNALAAAGHDRDAAVRALAEVGLSPDVRPERVDIEGFAGLYRRLRP